MAINSPRYQRWFIQQQATLTAFVHTLGVWQSTGAKLLRVDAGMIQLTRNAPYSRFPVLTGARSEVAGIRGRRLASFTIRGLPMIPSGTAGTLSDLDVIFQNIFGSAATVSAGVSATYPFLDSGYPAFSLIGFNHSSTGFTQQSAWACFVTRATFNFNGPFMTVDLEGFCGYVIDSTGFANYDSNAKAGLTAYPIEPVSPSIAGTPIQGFGTGYNLTINSNDISLKARALTVTVETGYVPIADVYGSPYLVAVVGDARRISISLGNLLDDDTAALNSIKASCALDNTTISGSIVAGNAAGSIFTFNINNILLEVMNLVDEGPTLAFEIAPSYAHASTPGLVNDMTLVAT